MILTLLSFLLSPTTVLQHAHCAIFLRLDVKLLFDNLIASCTFAERSSYVQLTSTVAVQAFRNSTKSCNKGEMPPTVCK